MSDILNDKSEALYQKDGQLYKHKSLISNVVPLSSLPPDTQTLFKPPPDSEPYILTTPSTIFHAQGGGQPTDTGIIKPKTTSNEPTFHVHQVRRLNPAILHLGTFEPPSSTFSSGLEIEQSLNSASRILNSRLHTAGHVIGLAISLLTKDGTLPADIVDGKASHYPGSSFVEFSGTSGGLIMGDKKGAIQAKVDRLVLQNLDIGIHFWSEEEAKEQCTGVVEGAPIKGDENGVRVVGIGELGWYPCGGTHVRATKELGKVAIRGIKRQKGVSKVSYEVGDA